MPSLDPTTWSSFRRGFFLTIGPLLTLLLHSLQASAGAAAFFAGPMWSLWGPWLYVALGLLPLLGASLVDRSVKMARGIIGLSAGLFAVLALPMLVERPGLTLALGLGLGSVLVWTWSIPWPRADLRPEDRVLGASLGAALVWVTSALLSAPDHPGLWMSQWLSVAVTLVVAFPWARALREQYRRLWPLVQGLLYVSPLAALAFWFVPEFATLWAWATLVTLGLGASRVRRSPAGTEGNFWEPLFEDPARLLVLSFLGTGFLGGVALSLPAASRLEGGARLLDAMFTSFSATCVTGLAVLDTPADFNFLGQLIILLLIQVGGLGIMTFSTAALFVLGKNLSLRHERTFAQLISDQDRRHLQTSLGTILGVTFLSEAAGAVLLTGAFWFDGDSFVQAVWRGVFTSISAFCNAGFALQSDSLVAYQDNPFVLHVVALLIIVGGLGPVVVVSLPRVWRRELLDVQTRIVLLSTTALLVLPAIFMILSEWTNTLESMGFLDRVTNGWFQSVTLRTAGFNSIALEEVRPATWTMMALLMFIGGSPGSTAGGIKTTTAVMLSLVVLAALRGRSVASIAGIRISQDSIYKAAASATLGLSTVLLTLFALQLTQNMSLEMAAFEAFSAVGTVGLSIGATATLDDVGKVIIMFAMFAGRVGPLTLFLLLIQRGESADWGRPSRDVAIG